MYPTLPDLWWVPVLAFFAFYIFVAVLIVFAIAVVAWRNTR
jgi:hypothetical protein